LINKVAEEAIGEKHPLLEKWPSDDFDSLYVLTLTWHNGKVTLLSHSYKQELNNGPQACPT
jgi:hypothetical protein